jgi:hypothetical protein
MPPSYEPDRITRNLEERETKMKTRIVLTLAFAAVLLLPCTASAAGNGLYTATINPTQACAGTPTDYALTISCTQIAQQGLGSAVVDIPAGFTIVGTPTITYPASKPWTVAIVGTTFVLTSNAAPKRLACGASGESVTVHFTATASDPALYTWTTRGYQSTTGTPDAQYSIDGPQPTVEILQCGEKCYATETAWATGTRYVDQGNWATYTPYVAGSTVTLYAGQTMNAGTVYFSPVADNQVTIAINLNADWLFSDVVENVKIQDYAFAPSGNPTPGLFDWKGDATGSSFSIVAPPNNYYGVHVDLQHEVECP